MAEAVDKDIEKEEGQQAAAPGDAGQGASGEATQQDAAAAEAAQPEGAEAAAAFGQQHRPVDAFGGAIIDSLVIDAPTVQALVELKNKSK